jgi:hypothetical protein
MASIIRNLLAQHRYQHGSRVFLEAFTKGGVISGLVFVIVLHVYTALVLFFNGLLPETIYPTLVFDACVGGGSILSLIACGRGKRGALAEWLSYLTTCAITIYAWIWFIEYLDPFDSSLSPFLYFPEMTVLLLAWCVVLLVSFGYILGAGIGAMVRFFQNGRVIRPAKARSRLMSVLAFAIPLAVVLISQPLTIAVIAEGTVKRTITVVDTNDTCTLSVWDLPDFLDVANIPSTTDINLTKLSLNQTRILNAFGTMNTTFYGQLQIGTPSLANQTISRLKVLDSFNLSVCWTIWDEINGFPGPEYPEIWINNARDALEFLIAKNITNVIGICADSEAGIEMTPDEYWSSIHVYDDFLKEVQSNASLAHPDPARGTFETVLCYAPQALQDFVDGDQDIVVWDGELGLPPNSWTDYHFMLYRLSPADNPSYLHIYLVLAKKYLGTSASVPIVGLTGVDWFAEGYTDGLNTIDRMPQRYHYDGIDGWDAMKREILYPKAMGFHSVSVFHLNSYGNLSLIEGYGLLDYYGVDAIEDLAASWNEGLTIEYPISSLDFRIRRQGFFNPNAAVIFDLFTNSESFIVLSCLLGITVVYPILKVLARWLFPDSYRVVERKVTEQDKER